MRADLNDIQTGTALLRAPRRFRLLQLVQPWLGERTFGLAELTLAGSLVGGVVGFAAELLCARYVGAKVYGVYAFALILASVGETIATWGLQSATLRFVSLHRDRDERRHVLGTIGASLLLPLVAGSVAAALLWLAAPPLASRMLRDDSAVPFIRAMAFAIPLLGLTEIMGIVTRSFGRAQYYVLIRNIVPTSAFLCFVLALRASRAEPLFVAVAYSTSYLLAAVVGVWCVVRVGGRDLFRESPVFPFRALYGYALPIFVNTVLYLAIGWTSIMVLSAQHDEEQIGLLRACIQFVTPLTLLVLAANASVGHVYPLLTEHDRREDLVLLVEKTTRWLSSFAVLGLLVIALNRHDLMLLMGPRFWSGGSALLVLAFAQTVMCYGSNAGFLLVLSGRQRVELANSIFVALLHLAMCLIWIPNHGSLGVAAVTAVSCIVVTVLRVIEVNTMMHLRTVEGAHLLTFGLAVLFGGAMWWVFNHVGMGEGTGVAHFVTRAALTAAGFGAVIAMQNYRRLRRV